MSWEFHYNSDRGILEFTAKGGMTPEEIDQMTLEKVRELEKSQARKVLLDFREIGNPLDVLGSFERAAQLEKTGVPKNFIGAIVVPEEILERFQFMETVYKNRGYNLTVFTDFQKAMDFLDRQGKPS